MSITKLTKHFFFFCAGFNNYYDVISIFIKIRKTLNKKLRKFKSIKFEI